VLEVEVGQGAFARVMKAMCPSKRTAVALKIMCVSRELVKTAAGAARRHRAPPARARTPHLCAPPGRWKR